MKFVFEPNEPHQIKAIEAVTSIFRKEEIKNKSENNFFMTDGAISNNLSLNIEDIKKNVLNIQNKNNLKPGSSTFKVNEFSIEMETGTGKTYVYLRTIFEFNKLYGIKKFIIIVPSLAIKEGVLKTLKLISRHILDIYGNIAYSYYEYDITKLKNFSYSDNLEIMVMTMASFNKDKNVLYIKRDQDGGLEPINYIKKSKPILILDEPQNMEGEITKEKMNNLNPLLMLRYSATHKNLINLVYKLTPAEAFKLGLVKKIEVLSIYENEDNSSISNDIKLLDVSTSKSKIKACVEVLIKIGGQTKRKKIFIKDGDDLKIKTKNKIYDGYKVIELTVNEPESNSIGSIKFQNGVELKIENNQNLNKESLMRLQIEHTIKTHIEKREILRKKGIKVLTLFFIDSVNNYIDEKGFIKSTFDEIFNKLKKKNKDLKSISAANIRKGYFAMKKDKYVFKESKIAENKEAFELIMKDKERLLSFEEKTEFIFTHSALKEGWDNPNVFNICTLNTTHSKLRKRQEIGRGLRICVNQYGDRIFDENINVLTIISNQHYESYVEGLQKEFEEDGIYNTIKPLNARKKILLKLNSSLKRNKKFLDLWKTISRKTKYEIKINDKKLITECVRKINDLDIYKNLINIKKTKLLIGKKDISIGNIKSEDSIEKSLSLVSLNYLDYIKEETNLTRKTIVKILSKVRYDNFFINPESFVNEIIQIINAEVKIHSTKNIAYSLINKSYDYNYFGNIISIKEKIFKITNKKKSIYNYVVFDSEKIEKEFVSNLDLDEKIDFFLKLPNWFKIKTPVGNYNPDWAILTKKIKNIKKIYFVIETKGSTIETERRGLENIKIQCAKQHYKTLDIIYKDVDKYSKFEKILNK